ncbi:hypothetical protein [Ferrimicrobium sp.]|uniref:hypothetical protein n=1 Tax=Ferrimicrobium sp. TaxID=2926050 RepID=UPI002612FE1B|nr:hypothetical protein [Ferrimicrobium sp.]
MSTWLDYHDPALVERAMTSLGECDTTRWEQSLLRANGDPRFALWLTLVDDLIKTYPPLQRPPSPVSVSVAQLQKNYLAGCSPLDAASLCSHMGESACTNAQSQPALTPGRS